MNTKPRFPRALALDVARVLCRALDPACAVMPDGRPALKVCGSLRRGRPDVGDIELVYIPRIDQVPEAADLLGETGRTVAVNRVDEVLEVLLAEGVLARRPNKLGRTAWGHENKLAVHVPSGLPVDLFSTTAEAWWGYVVCRTGSAESNTRIATAALSKGWRWHPTLGFFTDTLGRRHRITCEQDAFHLVGLPYKEPQDR